MGPWTPLCPSCWPPCCPSCWTPGPVASSPFPIASPTCPELQSLVSLGHTGCFCDLMSFGPEIPMGTMMGALEEGLRVSREASREAEV